MRKDAIECIVKRLVLAMVVAAAVVCGGSKHPQTVGAIALNAPQTDAGRPDPSRWNAMVGYPPSEASPQSGCPSRGAIALNRPNAPQSETVAEVDIERGWRLVKEATDAVSYAMPPNATVVGNWHRRGTFGEWLRYELGWGFPLGSNATTYSSFSVFNDAKIRPTPRDRSHEICAIGVPMLAMQGRSRFWVADGSGGETTLTWENFYLNADTNRMINAQIVLCESGDFVTRSNAVARYYARIDPNDWDGDGLANEIDDEPYTNDGDCFGTGEGWWAADAAAVAATNANPEAYYWLEFSATRDRTRVAVTCDGASDLGDMVVIARTNEMCRVPLLIGATYAVRATAPLAGIVTSDENAEVTFNDDIAIQRDGAGRAASIGDSVARTRAAPSRTIGGSRPYRAVAWGRASADFDVCYPLDFFFVPPPLDSGRTDYALTSTPVNVGAEIASLSGVCCTNSLCSTNFVWMCAGDCTCDGRHELDAAATWAGYLRRFRWNGACPCRAAMERAEEEIAVRGVSLQILDENGREIKWKDPVLVGEGVIVEVALGGEAMMVDGFVSMFAKALRLKAYSVGFDGTHTIADKPVPMLGGNVSLASNNVFHIAVPSEWLESNRLLSNAEDGRFAKTSIDMSDAVSGDSQRTDSDIFDENVGGLLQGRARGKDDGNPSAAIPEGAFNKRTVQAAGTASFVAHIGYSQSPAKQAQQQADIIYYSGHGNHDTGVLNGVAGAEDVAGHWSHVGTLVFAGCSVLDVGDRANRYKNAASHSANPGLKWIRHSGATVLLGYAFKAPRDEQGGIKIVREWCGQRADLGDVEAWMRANDNPNGRNACAIQKFEDGKVEYHYFMKQGRGWNLRNKYTEIIEVIEL